MNGTINFAGRVSGENTMKKIKVRDQSRVYQRMVKYVAIYHKACKRALKNSQMGDDEFLMRFNAGKVVSSGNILMKLHEILRGFFDGVDAMESENA